MSAPELEASVSAPEIIGGFKVHEIAALFPMLTGAARDELKQSLMQHGQQQPIVVKDGLLVDGRNRLEILLELGEEPVIQEYVGLLAIEDYILIQNLHRRHLSDPQRLVITTKAMLWKETKAAQTRQQEGGKRHGRGRRKAAANSTQPIRQPTVSEKIAAAAKTTDYQARQAVAVARHAPEFLEQVATGNMPLRVAGRVARRRRAAFRRHPTQTRMASSKRRPHWSPRSHNTIRKYPGKREELQAAIMQAFSPAIMTATIQ